jgi:hypothetical protein
MSAPRVRNALVVFNPRSEEFFRCKAHYHLTTQPSVFGPEFDLLFIDPDDATLGNGRTPDISACISQKVLLGTQRLQFHAPPTIFLLNEFFFDRLGRQFGN